MRLAVTLACFAVLAGPVLAQDAPYDAEGWKADAAQVREALTSRYANLEWAQTVREADLGKAFDSADQRLGGLKSDAEARAMFDGLTRRLGDGHLRFQWPSASAPGGSGPGTAKPASPCASVVGRRIPAGPPIVASLPGYEPLSTPQSALFPAGIMTVDGRRVGVLRVGLFSADLEPKLCDEALATVQIPADCGDDACLAPLYYATYARLTEAFAGQLRAVKAAGAQTLLIDLTGNGGGSEWVEAAVRMVSGKRLKSSQVRFVRGEHWSRRFASDIEELEAARRTAKGADKALLTDLLAQVKAAKALADAPCDGAPLLQGKTPACDYLGRGVYSSGLMASADPKALAGKSWASAVFQPVAFPYEEGVWSGPLLIAVDENTASASEEFVAILQDNKAAVVVGMPTAGAGCGYTNGGSWVTLKHSGGVLKLPDCARFRADGSNEVAGISPDVLTGYHSNEGPRARAVRLGAVLPEAVRLAGQ